MGKKVEDNFIADLATTIKVYKERVPESQELDVLIEVASDMLAALGALRMRQVKTRQDATRFSRSVSKISNR